MKQCLISIRCHMLHVVRKSGKRFLSYDLQHLIPRNRYIIIENVPVLFLRAYFLDRSFQIMEKFWIGKYCKVLHVNGKILHYLPDLLFLSGQYRLCISGSICASPPLLFQELQALMIILACNQLVDRAV